MIGSENSNPTAFGQGQTANDRELFLDIFGGEVLTAFDLATVTAGKVTLKQLGGGMRSARFPKMWKANAAYHQRGQELLGEDIETGEITITPDELLVSHTAIYDMDEMLSHFEVRSGFSKELGRALARVYDKNNFRQAILAARTPNDGPFPGGNVISDVALAADVNGKYDGVAWIDAIRQANRALFLKDVPDDLERFMVVDYDIFDAIKFAKDANGQFLILSNQLQGAPATGGHMGQDESLTVDGVTIVKSRNKPNTDESADTSVYSKYRADYSNTKAVLWTPMTIANVMMRDITVEHQRDARRQEDFMVASMAAGHGALRPETGVEFLDV